MSTLQFDNRPLEIVFKRVSVYALYDIRTDDSFKNLQWDNVKRLQTHIEQIKKQIIICTYLYFFIVPEVHGPTYRDFQGGRTSAFFKL